MSLQSLKTKRDNCIDWCRLLGISLVVIGHSGCPSIMKNYIYLFHMSLFFFLSGYCYRDENDKHFVKYVIKKIRTLYIPYIVYNGIFVLLHNIFLRLSIYTSDVRFLSLEYGNDYGVMQMYSLREIIRQLIRTFLFAANEEMGGATWFLRILFVVCVFHCLIGALVYCVKLESHRNAICYCIGVIFLLVGWIFDVKSIHLPLELQTVFSAYFPFALGVLWRKKINEVIQKSSLSLRISICVACGIVLLFMSRYHSIGLGLNSVVNPVFYGGATIMGCMHVFLLSDIISKLICNKVINKVAFVTAKNSLYIVFFHFLAFKIVTYLYVVNKKLPLYYLASFPTLVASTGGWIIYSIIGISIPVLLSLGMHKLLKPINAFSSKRKGESQ